MTPIQYQINKMEEALKNKDMERYNLEMCCLKVLIKEYCERNGIKGVETQ